MTVGESPADALANRRTPAPVRRALAGADQSSVLRCISGHIAASVAAIKASSSAKMIT